jgi:hypothetical protein
MQGILVQELTTGEDGMGAAVLVGNMSGKPLLLTLDITQILEQGSIDISIWGSSDTAEWRQLAVYPRKFYCGTYLLLVDLSRELHVRYLRAQWRLGRWGEQEQKPVTGFCIAAEELMCRTASAAA